MASYGARYTVPFYSLDGFFYRALVRRRGYTGDAEELRFYACRVEHGRPGLPDFTEPLPGSKITLSILDRAGGYFSPIVGSDDGAWQIILQRDTTADFSTAVDIGTWYVLPERYTSTPFEPVEVSSIVGVDGFGLLSGILYEPLADNVVLSVFLDALEALGMQSGLRTLMRWRPWAASPRSFPGDELGSILFTDDLWTDDTGRQSTLLAALRAVAGRFWLRVFQSEGYWYAWQRHTLIGGAPTVWERVTAGGASTEVPLSITVSNQAIAFGGSPVRELLPRVREVTSTYRPSPTDTPLILNGSFEDSENYWGFFGGVSYWDIEETGGVTHAELASLSSSMGASAGDALALRVFADVSGGALPRAGAVQEAGIIIAENVAQEIALEYNAQVGTSGVISVDIPAIIQLEIGGFLLYHVQIEALQAALHGEKATVYIEPLGDPATNTDRIVGTEVIPAGTVINFVAAGSDPYFDAGSELTLSRPAKIGDNVLVGRLSADVALGHIAYAHFWENEPSSSFNVITNGGSTFRRTQIRACLVTPQGEPVSGALKVTILMPSATAAVPTSTPSSGAWSDLDDFDLRLYSAGTGASGGRAVREIRWQAAVGTPQHGDSIEAGPFLLGDGPTPEADSRLRYIDGTGTIVDTLQGANTGWKDGAYGVAEASTGESLDMLYARKLLLAQSEGLERLLCDFTLRGQQKLFPHNLLRHYQFTRLAYAVASGAAYVLTYIPIRPGTTVMLGAESFEVTACTGLGPYRCAVDGAWANDYDRGEPLFYTKDFCPDYLDWDVPAGRLRFEGTELMESSQDYTIRQIIQEA